MKKLIIIAALVAIAVPLHIICAENGRIEAERICAEAVARGNADAARDQAAIRAAQALRTHHITEVR